ncbi:hypothetical protein N7I30_19865 [Aurantimonas litoralis]|nr:hypothetical protein [Aurantimonas litoralis]
MVASSVSVIDGLYPNLEEVQGLRSPRTAASATFALKAGLWFRLGLFVIVSPDPGHPGRLQADNPLSPLCRLAESPLIIDRVGMSEWENDAIRRHGISLLREVLAGLITRLDTPPFSDRHHPVSAIVHPSVREADRVKSKTLSTFTVQVQNHQNRFITGSRN